MHDSVENEVTDPAQFWETRYLARRGEEGRMWSGRVNAAVEREASGLTPGSALELGCGEGADALWLAARGWTVTAVDISSAALSVGAAEADRAGLGDRITWVRANLATWAPSSEFDLVTSAFLHSPVELPREQVLRRAATAVAPGGRLLVVGHGEFPAGTRHGDHHDAPPMPTSDEVLASLELSTEWVVETKGDFARDAVRPDGTTFPVSDTVLRIRRER